MKTMRWGDLKEALDMTTLSGVKFHRGKYSVKAIQRQTVVGREDRDAVLSLPSFGALECRDTHLGFQTVRKQHLCLFYAKGCVWIGFTEYLLTGIESYWPGRRESVR